MLATMLATMIPSLAAVVLAAFLYLTRFLGHSLNFASIGFFHIHGLTYTTPNLTITIAKFDLRFKLPSSSDPSWGVVTISGYEYKDAACHVSMDYCLTKLWFFPVFYRFSFGPWIDATIEGFVMHVYESQNTPPLLQSTRSHLFASTLNGDTVRLGHFNTKLFFGRNAMAPVSYASESEEEEGTEGRENDASNDAKSTKNGADHQKAQCERDDVRVRVTLEQWQMVTLNHRMYTFGEVQGELRRSWMEDRGSVVVIMKDVTWTKLPPTDRPLGKGRGNLWELARGMFYLPSHLFTLVRDPVALADLHLERFDVTFCNFRIRDAELLKQALIRAKQEHFDFEKRHPGLIGDFAWDMFVHGVYDLCRE